MATLANYAGRRSLVLLAGLAAGVLFLGATTATEAQTSPTPAAATPAVATDNTGGWPHRIQGKPADFHRGAEGGYYFWHDDAGLHLWVTDPENIDSHYTGTITTSGSFTNVSLERPESDDSYRELGSGQITYNLHTQSGIDGLDFEIAGDKGTTLELDLYRDGHLVANGHIFEGTNDVNAKENPLFFTRH